MLVQHLLRRRINSSLDLQRIWDRFLFRHVHIGYPTCPYQVPEVGIVERTLKVLSEMIVAILGDQTRFLNVMDSYFRT